MRESEESAESPLRKVRASQKKRIFTPPPARPDIVILEASRAAATGSSPTLSCPCRYSHYAARPCLHLHCTCVAAY
jgi:hypothetical protein